MSTQARERTIKLQVGALILVAVVLLAGFLVLLGSVSFGKGSRLAVDFDFSGNLQKGAPVKISGIKVGKVEEVRFLGGQLDERVKRRVQVRMTVWIEESARESIRQNAEFFVNTAGVLGEQYLEIAPGAHDRPPLDFDLPVRGVDPPRTDLIVARLYELLDSITSLLRDDKDVIRNFLKSGASLVRTLDQLLQENRTEIGKLIRDVDKFTIVAQGLVASLHRGVGDASQLQRILANLESLSGTVRRDIDPLIAKVKKALDGVESVTSLVGPAEKQQLARALDELVTVGDKVERVAVDAQSLVADLKQGKGTAGALLVDQQIYDDLRELVRDLKRNPWKFFWKE